MTPREHTAAVTAYAGHVTHARTAPVSHRFRHPTRMWLVDLDAMSRRSRRWRAADHVGDPRSSLRDNIAAVFARNGVPVDGYRLLMLGQPRGSGHAFNPITLHWAVTRDAGTVRAVVAEVHNTYGGRCAYLLDGHVHSTGTMTATVEKALYVSPFFGTDGSYTIRVSAPGKRITVTVTLQPSSGPPFVAAVHLERLPDGTADGVLHPVLAGWRTSALIRYQGIRLWAKGVGIHPRPIGHDQELSAPRAARATSGADRSGDLLSEVAP